MSTTRVNLRIFNCNVVLPYDIYDYLRKKTCSLIPVGALPLPFTLRKLKFRIENMLIGNKYILQ